MTTATPMIKINDMLAQIKAQAGIKPAEIVELITALAAKVEALEKSILKPAPPKHEREPGLASHARNCSCPLCEQKRFDNKRAYNELVTRMGFKQPEPAASGGPERETAHLMTPVQGTANYPLFKHMRNDHGLILTESDMDEIVRVVHKMIDREAVGQFTSQQPEPATPNPGIRAFTVGEMNDMRESRVLSGGKMRTKL